ncbi:MAG: hypothetical protein H6981_07690 [Gammaproteobacteria bacterium]|nr:hypothetical protein [Gammaproteobacteria bacterium]MCP5136666.1 hypothetical protein [Gammaproteobacteria bacterium]
MPISSLVATFALSLALAGDLFIWIWTSWMSSPLDTQGPVWLVAALAIWGLGLKSRQNPATRIGITLLTAGALISVIGLLIDINLLRALALTTMLTGLAALSGISMKSSLIGAALMILAIPTTAFLLGNVIHSLTGLGYHYGVIIKWPIAALLILPLALQHWRTRR